MDIGIWLILAELVVTVTLQGGWMLVYHRAFGRTSPLAKVWLSKAAVLLAIWLLLGVNERWHLPDWAWYGVVGPALMGVNAWWFDVTRRVARHLRSNPRT